MSTEVHRPDWTHVDFENGEDADCTCGFNGTHRECEAARTATMRVVL